MGRFTLICTIIGTALCLVHYIWHDSDPIYLLFYALSVPAWFAPIFTNVATANIAVIYLLTILSWTVIGYVIDRFAHRTTNKQR
jgi:hypothetical protein